MTSIYRVLGLMSGTSLDGLDLAYCSFRKEEGKWKFSIDDSSFVAYDPEFMERLKNAIELSAIELLKLNNSFGSWLGEQSKQFIERNKLDVDFISSHGHTIFHQIDKKLTYQIGSGQHLANASGQKVICDFRTLDVALGGQGAPLAPIGDKLLFSEYDFCLNLGGISNASFRKDDQRLAFDIVPANMLLSHILKSTDLSFDDKGKLARSGKMSEGLFKHLNVLNFYAQPFPKSLGYEWFCENIIPIIEESSESIEDQLHTAVHHIAFQISQSLKPHAGKQASLLVTGGGAKNTFLIEIIQQYLGKAIQVIVPSSDIVDFKEALVFAFMGVLRNENKVNSLRSVTGASTDSSGGVIFKPSF